MTDTVLDRMKKWELCPNTVKLIAILEGAKISDALNKLLLELEQYYLASMYDEDCTSAGVSYNIVLDQCFAELKPK